MKDEELRKLYDRDPYEPYSGDIETEETTVFRDPKTPTPVPAWAKVVSIVIVIALLIGFVIPVLIGASVRLWEWAV